MHFVNSIGADILSANRLKQNGTGKEETQLFGSGSLNNRNGVQLHV